jgi:hypothetical protein
VGAERDDSFAGAAYLFNTGAAYVFGRDEGGAGNWGQVNKLTASDAEDADFFGVSVAVSGDTVVAGAYQETTLGSAAGAAYVFDLQLPKPTATPTPTPCPTGKVPADSGCGTPTPTITPNPGPGVIERVGDVTSYSGMAISDDGRFVAFRGAVVDRKSGTAQPLPGDGKGSLAMSGDGRYVAFASHAVLVPEDDTVTQDVYVFDRELASYELVSGASDGSSGNESSGSWDDIAISADGRFVAFSSRASDLVPDDTNICFDKPCQDVFVRDRLLGTTERVSVASDGTEGDARSGDFGVSISADGRFVAFDSGATNLVPDGGQGVYVRDRDTDDDGLYDEPGAVETVLVTEQGIWPAISDDGRFVAYRSWDGTDNIVLNDRQNETTTVIAQAGFLASGTAFDLSGDGRYLAFATHLPQVPEDTNGFVDVYLYDRLAATNELLSVAKDGSLGNNDSAASFKLENLAVIALTPDARYAAFPSGATNFLPGEGAGVFVAGAALLGIEDTDGDGCSDEQELGPQASLGGQRDPESFWDFFDVPVGDPAARDRRVNVLDIGAVIVRFGSARETPPTKEEALAEALSPPPPAPAYHAASDRGGPIPGQDLWNLLPPDGSINIIDIGAVVVQFGHTCA